MNMSSSSWNEYLGPRRGHSAHSLSSTKKKTHAITNKNCTQTTQNTYGIGACMLLHACALHVRSVDDKHPQTHMLGQTWHKAISVCIHRKTRPFHASICFLQPLHLLIFIYVNVCLRQTLNMHTGPLEINTHHYPNDMQLI